MFETFKAIKDDPRSSTGVFRALKRNTSHGSDGYCAYTFHNFGIAAEAEFTTVHEDDIRSEAFEVCVWAMAVVLTITLCGVASITWKRL